MLEIQYTTRFKKDLKIAQKRGYNTTLLKTVIECLAHEDSLPPKHKDHALIGNYVGYRECHITPDWLLIYKIEKEVVTLILSRTGTHSDLFGL